MDYILKELPNIIIYFVSGYIFNKVYSVVKCIDKQKDFENMFLKCVVSGFVLKNAICIIPIRFNENVNVIGLMLISALLAYFMARTYKSKYTMRLLKKIGIRRTTNNYFWEDIMDNDEYTLWVQASSKDLNYDYFGILVLVEDANNNPQIVLSNYLKRYLDDSVVIVDHYSEPEYRVVIDTSKCDTIELIYNSNSEKIKEIIDKMEKETVIHEENAKLIAISDEENIKTMEFKRRKQKKKKAKKSKGKKKL